MSGTDHDALRDAAGVYVLGALPALESAQFRAHMAICEECQNEVRALRAAADVLPYAVPQVDPPPALRARVLAVVGARPTPAAAPKTNRPLRSPVTAAWLSAAAMLVMALGLSAYTVVLRGRVGHLERRLRAAVARLDRTEQQLASAARDAQRAQGRLAVLTAPDMQQLDLAGQSVAPRAAGRAFLSRSNGLLFAASQLPPLPAGRIYQVWYLTPGAPLSAGLIAPDQTGRVIVAFDGPIGAASLTGLAVSIEPTGGVEAPTGAIYLAGPSH